MAEERQELISVVVDGSEVKAPPGTNLIQAAAMAGVEIPHFCYHPHLSVAGNCRMCLVEIGMPARPSADGEPALDEGGKPKIAWQPKPVIGCATAVLPGLHVRTNSELARQCHEGVMEFLLINHPLDCPICDQAGECRLQEYATDYGRGGSRFTEQKIVKPKRVRIGPQVILDDERCILCSRCIRFCKEILGEEILGFVERGGHTTLACHQGKQLDSNYSLNTVDICPVGALTSADFRFKMRVWFLKETPGICAESSAGVNTTVWSREGKIHRITPRRNDEVNDSWMSDSGRMLYKTVDAPERLKEYTLDHQPVTAEEALLAANELIRRGKVAFVASGRASVEEQWLLKKIIESAGNPPAWLIGRAGEGDGLLVSADRNPNVRGALAAGLIGKLPETHLHELAVRIGKGEFETVVSVGEDLIEAGLTKELLHKVDVVYFATHGDATSALAKVVLPILTVFEKSGTFINQQFRVQKFFQAVPGPRDVLADIDTLGRLLGMLKNEPPLKPAPQAVWERMSREILLFANMSFDAIPATGQLLDASKFHHLHFPETKSLHFKFDTSMADK